MTATILVVEPDYFTVSYCINPWMKPDIWAADPRGMQQAARRSFDHLCEALREAKCELIVTKGAPGLPDMVFPANAAIVLNGRALMAHFRHPERRGEEPFFRAIFQKLQNDGLIKQISRFPEGCHQEGAGDCIWDAHRQLFWAAYGPRSSQASLREIESFFQQTVVPMELVSNRCYHLDLCFCPLAGGEIVYYPPALTPAALRNLHERVPADQLIEATEEDLACFSVNAVSVNHDLVMGQTTPSLRSRLRERGYRVIEVDLTPFMLSGGGAYCLTLRLDRSSSMSVG